MIEHSKLPPSSAARRMACPGSRAMEEQYGSKESTEESEEGRLAHDLAALYLIGYDDAISRPGDLKYTDEMHEGAMFYLREVQKLFSPGALHVEKRINIHSIHEECWGTPDAWISFEPELHVFDYKFGFTPVEVYENWQLLEYAGGILYEGITDIYLHIIQPRDHISPTKHRIWHLTIDELEIYKRRLQISEALSMTPQAPLRISEQCKFCKARHVCPALQQAAFGAAEMTYRATDSHTNVGNELKLLHEARDLLEYRITALEVEAQYLLQRGVSVENYELALSPGRLNWMIDKEQVLELGEVLGVNLQKPDILTPTQAIKAGVAEETVLKYAERKQSIKLTKINLTKSKQIFGGV